MERARDMPALESLWAANIQQHKPGRARSQRRVNVPAVGFERQELLKVIEGRLRIGSCDCGSGGATDGGDAAAALQPDTGHDTYRLSPPVLHHVGRCTGFGISRVS